MKRTLKLLCAIGLVASFLAMATAMVLPHSHLHSDGTETQHHACWICQAKAIGVSTPEVGPNLLLLHRVAHLAPPAQAVLPPQLVFFFTQARAPPQSFPVLP